MYRKERIYQFIEQCVGHIGYSEICKGYEGISTKDIAEATGLDRANCSKELNRLHKEKRLVKINGRPVRYFPVERLQRIFGQRIEKFELISLMELSRQSCNTFETIIGYNGSLKVAIDKARAAMIYPPHGLHTILSGETGVGKTLFAHLMHDFAVENGFLATDAPFVTFNCSEYTDNPQLLLSTLFGYKKGAFTGADQDREGLVGKADTGILFLDEVHRLPAEGQEMLFQLIDSGHYRRLGDSEKNSSAQVLIIGATTEPLESVMLATFLRRIPMVIDLPNINERGIDERFDLLHLYFNHEYEKLQKKIVVQRGVMKSLLGYRCAGNVGQLKADIKLICARSYLESILSNSEELYISKKLLPTYVLDGLLTGEQNDELTYLYSKFPKDFVFDGSVAPEYKMMQQNWLEDIHETDSLQGVKKELEKSILAAYPTSRFPRSENEGIFKIVEPSVYYEVMTALKLAEKSLQRKFSKRTHVAFAMHVNALLNRTTGPSQLTLNVKELEKNYMAELKAAKQIMEHIENELRVSFSQQEIYLFALFLTMDENQHGQRVGLLVLAHGSGIAKNTVKVANTLLDTDHAHALDMQLEKRVDEFYEEVEAKAKEIDQGKGILLLTDMGSLVSFGEQLTERTGIPTRTIDLVSTPYVLEALHKTLITSYELDEIYQELKEAISTHILGLGKKEPAQDQYQQKVIITTCITGHGAAITLANFLRNSLPLISQYNIELLPTNSRSFRVMDLKEKQIVAVVGIEDLHLPQVPFIPSEQILLADGLAQLTQAIQRSDGTHTVEYQSSMKNVIGIHQILEESLNFLNPKKTLKLILHAFEKIENQLELEPRDHYLVSFCLHTASMLERVIRNETFDYVDIQKHINLHSNSYCLVRSALQEIEDHYMLEIPDTELGYLMDIFDTEQHSRTAIE
ncbi:sigma 54-interacting transcriptional regulator [Enterococcus sp. AZ109]|uniref:sigma 54-interacting transcriptional regulator n=1 Tax=Enterococcus sp. AZ109 TaxID=2774634 RepID=UPI003F2688E3